ncbi:hypothetical protein LWI28_019775 [Acer negundo]|uniref:Uncharacterized protein n=1 Tax=Acer negundo TaxID=4023 RepID=A0AAD5IJX8_ACENE|nr:hypothetical protein LWI28_019775 [Acer negundo]
MESSSMHGQFTIGEWLSSTLFLGLMNLEADLSFRLSLVVNLQAIVTLLAIPLITVSSSWQGTCLKVESVIPLGSPSVCKNSVGESMLHGVSVYHSLIPLTVHVTSDSPVAIEAFSSRQGLIDHRGLYEQHAILGYTPVMHSLQVTSAIPTVTSDISDLNTSLISLDFLLLL